MGKDTIQYIVSAGDDAIVVQRNKQFIPRRRRKIPMLILFRSHQPFFRETSERTIDRSKLPLIKVRLSGVMARDLTEA